MKMTIMLARGWASCKDFDYNYIMAVSSGKDKKRERV